MPPLLLIHFVEQEHLVVKLSANCQTQLTLPPNRRAQMIQLLILLSQHVAMILVNLLVRQLAVVRRASVIWIVAIREQRSSVRGFRC